MEVANTILKQIKATDFWALGSWGANQYVGYREGNDGFNGAYILGGVRFKIRTPKYLKGVYVNIYLMGNDTYSVRVCRVIGTNLTELAYMEDVYCDMLVQVIDGLIENKRETVVS